MAGEESSIQVDYAIIGGGSAGSALASRLSERSSNSILLIEAGQDYPPGEEPSELLDSFAGTAHSNPLFTWTGLTAAFRPRPSNAPDERPRPRYTAARVIGGGSSINGMCANRGLPSDYEDWAVRGATGWDWEGVLPSFRRMETDTDFDGPLHGKDGPIGLRRLFEDRWPGYTKAVMQAVSDQGWKNIADQNGVFEDGFFPLSINNIDDQRISAATAYLTREVRGRGNFDLMDEARAERLLFDGTKVIGVRVRRPGGLVDIHAKEVIVSMGAIHSPAFLLRSGIGPGDELGALGIDVVADRRGVGKHLMEHPGVNFGSYMKRESRLTRGLRRQMLAGLRWSSGHEDCPAGDMYFVPTNKASWHDIGSRLGLAMVWVNKSYSTGEVTLKSPDMNEFPAVDFDMCSDRRDLDRLVKATRMLARLHAEPAIREAVHEIFPISYSARARKLAVYSRYNKFQTWLGGQVMDASGPIRRLIIDKLIADGPTIDELMHDDAVVEQWVRDTVVGHWHASCSCRMGAPDDPGAVTDPHGRVYGVSGLRVCDASIFPTVPCANTNIPTIMVGEKLASLMLAE
jgi:5-(hydroxymethyl)furfural/furfural oxidase